MVYLTSGFQGSALQAIRLGRTGDLTGTDAIVWSHKGGTPYVPSPLLTDNLLYILSGNTAKLSSFDARSGEIHLDSKQLEGIQGVYASPVSAGDRVYILGRDGACVVLKKGPGAEVLAVNKLADTVHHTDASMALAGKEIFLRTARDLYCITQQQ